MKGVAWVIYRACSLDSGAVGVKKFRFERAPKTQEVLLSRPNTDLVRIAILGEQWLMDPTMPDTFRGRVLLRWTQWPIPWPGLGLALAVFAVVL